MCRSSATISRGQTRPQQRFADYTWHVYADGDGLWYVEITVTQTGQVLTCGAYDQRPADHRIPAIAARLYDLRKRENPGCETVAHGTIDVTEKRKSPGGVGAPRGVAKELEPPMHPYDTPTRGMRIAATGIAAWQSGGDA